MPCYTCCNILLLFSHSVMSSSLWLHGLQHDRLPCTLSPRIGSRSCSLSQWCYLTISSSATPSPFVFKLSGGSDSKESACNAGDLDSILGLGRSPGEGNGYLLQYSYLENSMNRGASWATVHGVIRNLTWLSDWHYYTLTVTILSSTFLIVWFYLFQFVCFFFLFLVLYILSSLFWFILKFLFSSSFLLCTWTLYFSFRIYLKIIWYFFIGIYFHILYYFKFL